MTTDDSSHNENCKIGPVHADWHGVCASINLGLFHAYRERSGNIACSAVEKAISKLRPVKVGVKSWKEGGQMPIRMSCSRLLELLRLGQRLFFLFFSYAISPR